MAGPFAPQGPTYRVGIEAVQCAGLPGGSTYRIRNLQVGDAYLTWGDSDAIVSVVPDRGAPAENTLGFGGGRIETVTLPADAWFIADSIDSFEVTPGEGA